MLGFKRLALVALLSALAFGSTGRAAAPPTKALAAAPAAGVHALDRADLETWLDGMLPFALKNGDIAGAVVVVVKDGQVLLQKGYGKADVARGVPMDPDRTEMRPGSTSKLFTWTAVMQLVEAGKIDLDRNVDDYLDFKVSPRKGRPISMRDLMNHRAGFEEGLKGILSTDPNHVETTEHYLKTHPRPLLFAPGEAPAYSNYGAALAGYIVQRVSGEPFERYVEHHILTPLGMDHTTFDQPLPQRLTDDMARGYRTASGPPQPFEDVITAPAGSATTTAADMARFMLAHLQGGRLGDRAILSPQTTALMHTPSEPAFRPGFDTMAHGFFHQERNGHLMIGHGGDTIVFHTEMDLLPDDGVGIFYSFNSRGVGDAVYGARQGLLDGFMNRYFPAPPPAPLPALATAVADAHEIAGVYQSTRRIEHGFLSLFYLLQQSPIVANADGTISAADPLGRSIQKLKEVGPGLWRQVDGTRELALTTVNGVKTVIDSDDPITVLQKTPTYRSTSLNLLILMLSMLIAVWTLVLWALSPWLRLGDRNGLALSKEARRLRLALRLAALFDVAWLFGWVTVVQPILGSHVEVYGPAMDPLITALELGGYLTVLAAAAGLWASWRMFRTDATWLSRLWTLAVTAALFGVVWLGFLGKLIGLDLNY
jgi:CubicO group peptidase (beta-lactamase class C family)